MTEARPSRALAPLGLFLLTILSVMHTGAGYVGEAGPAWRGWTFAVPLLTILVAHELGHYVAARVHGVPASLPHFLPLPYLSPFGTAGAIIGMTSRISSRRALLDIGAAGPLAGMVFALPLLGLGLSLSEVKPASSPSLIEGDSLLYLAMKAAFARPIPAGHDVYLHPTAFAGWTGLFLTMVNLLPIGQLDGGHVAYALLGDRANTLGRWLHRGLLALFVVNAARNLLRARGHGISSDAVITAVSNSTFWLLWFGLTALVLRASGGVHPPTDEGEPLGPGRRAVAVACLALFVLLFMATPLRVE
ncbi:MAG: site-2 protease family protein [Polyangiaceae bacterium]|nr:site-2 protease family protein [Polyangiaceae bacterium]